MYDMYPWDSASQGDDYPPQPLRSVRSSARRAPKPRNGSAPNGSAPNGSARDITPAQAVQAALDRRDNGGEGHPAGPAATMPAASQARQ
jgi:hypothetical protein